MNIKRLKEGDLPYILLFVVLGHIFFYKFLIPGQMAFGTDTISQGYPMQVLGLKEMFEQHSLPLWNPYLFSGMPLLASFSFQILYPLNWIYFFMPVKFAMGYQFIMHSILMGIFFYYFARHLRLSRQAAFIGGLLFMFSGHLISLIYPGHGGKIFTITWLPLALLFLDRALEDKPFYNLTLMGLIVGLMFFAGHIQIMFYCGIALLMFLVFRVAAGIRARGTKWAARGVAGFCFAFALGTLLYAVMLFPAWQYKGYTQRAGGLTGASTYQFATSFSQPPEDMLYIFLRNPFGWGKDYGPDFPNTHDIFYRGRIGLRLSIDYFSIFGLMLAFIGAAFVRNRYTWYASGLALLSMFLALGMFNPWYIYVYKYVPGFSMFRVPYAIMILLPFCFSTLAAFGLQKLLDLRKDELRKLDFVIGGGAILGVSVLGVALYWGSNMDRTVDSLLSRQWIREMLWNDFSDVYQRLGFFLKNLYVFVMFLAAALLVLFVYRRGWLKVKYLTAVLAVCILFEVWPVGWEFIKTVPYSSVEGKFFKESGQIKTIEADHGDDRVLSLVSNNELPYYGIRTLAGYHAVPLEYYEKLLDSISFDNGIINMLDAKYLMLPKEPEYDFASFPDDAGGNRMKAKYEALPADGMYFYKNHGAGRKAWLAGTVWKAGGEDEALGIVSDPRFDPFKMAVLTKDLDMPVDRSADLSRQKVEVTSYKPDRVEYAVSAPAAALMVASEVWYPGWKAYIDGKETEVFRTDYALRGIYMPAGEHKVVFKFEPFIFRVGVAVSLATLLFFAAVIGPPAYRKWRDARGH